MEDDQLIAAANFKLFRETSSKYWSIINNPKKSRDIIMELEIPGSEPKKYERKSKCMTEIGRDYHENLKKQDIKENKEEKAQITAELLEKLETEVPAKGRKKLRTRITIKQIEKALKHLKNNSAAGLDGIPYEFWKTPKEI